MSDSPHDRIVQGLGGDWSHHREPDWDAIHDANDRASSTFGIELVRLERPT